MKIHFFFFAILLSSCSGDRIANEISDQVVVISVIFILTVPFFYLFFFVQTFR